jgi:hypothetical protein
MAVALCSELVTDEHEPLELPSSSSYSAALMHGVAEQVRATISAYPPPTRAEEQRLLEWCSELEDASAVLGAAVAARPRSAVRS